MSNEAREWVWTRSASRGVDRLVMLALAEEANPDGLRCWPSQRRLAERVGVNRATVRRSIERLEALGELVVKRPDRVGRGRFTRYALVMDRDADTFAATLDPTWSVIAPPLFPQVGDNPVRDGDGKARPVPEKARPWAVPDPQPKRLRPPVQSPLVAVVDGTAAAAAVRRTRDMARLVPCCDTCGDDGRIVDDTNTVRACPACTGARAN